MGYLDPPDPPVLPLTCLLCGGRTLDEELDIDSTDLIFDANGGFEDFSAVACPICGDAGGLVASDHLVTDAEWAAIINTPEPDFDDDERQFDYETPSESAPSYGYPWHPTDRLQGRW